MNKVKRIILIFGIFLILNGCSIKNENSMNITKEGEVNYSIIIAFDRELLSNVIKTQYLDNNEYETITDDIMKEYVKNNIKDSSLLGLDKKDYVDENFIGIEYKYNIKNIDDVSSNKAEEFIINKYDDEIKLTDKKLFTKNDDVYTAKYIYEKINDNEVENENISYYSLFKVTLPIKAKSSNATKVINNGKTLIWEMNNNEKYDINFSFKLYDNIYIFFAAGLAVIVISIIVIYGIKIKKEVKK